MRSTTILKKTTKNEILHLQLSLHIDHNFLLVIPPSCAFKKQFNTAVINRTGMIVTQ